MSNPYESTAVATADEEAGPSEEPPMKKQKKEKKEKKEKRPLDAGDDAFEGKSNSESQITHA